MGAVIRTSTMPPAQAKTDHWALLARIAAHRDRFGASDAIAASAALLLVRTQLMLGVASARELQEFAKVVGVEALVLHIGAFTTAWLALRASVDAWQALYLRPGQTPPTGNMTQLISLVSAAVMCFHAAMVISSLLG